MYSILVVDDEPLVVQTLQKFLKQRGYNIIPMVNGLEANKLLQSDAQIDLMIVDLKMPGIHGTDLIGEADKRKIPSFIISGGYDAIQHVNYLKGLGYKVDNLFYKPIDLHKLVEEIKKVLPDKTNGST